MTLTSILMPVKNESAFLAECFASIRTPPFMTLQIVLVDDHSTDDTYRIATDIAARRKDLQITVLRNTGQGKAAALNLAYQAASADHFIFLAGDDLLISDLLPERIATVNGKGPLLAQCRYRTFSDNPDHDGVIFPRAGRRAHLAGGAVSFNRAFAELYFPIPETLPNEDTWLWAISTLYGLKAAFIDKIGLYYRIHAHNSIAASLNFFETSKRLSDRHEAFALAAALPHGTASGKARLSRLVQAEAHRRSGHWWRLIAMRGTPVAERIMFIFNSTKWLFAIKRQGLSWVKRLSRFKVNRG